MTAPERFGAVSSVAVTGTGKLSGMTPAGIDGGAVVVGGVDGLGGTLVDGLGGAAVDGLDDAVVGVGVVVVVAGVETVGVGGSSPEQPASADARHPTRAAVTAYLVRRRTVVVLNC